MQNPHLPTWVDTHAFRTGCFFTSVMAGVQLKPGYYPNGNRDLDSAVCDPGFGGYCLDAPDFSPAGAQYRPNGQPAQPRIVARPK